MTSNLCNQENIANVPNSFAAAIKGQNVLPNFRKILRNERMNEKEEELQQDRRQKNLMVFGASESKEVTDEEFIKNLKTLELTPRLNLSRESEIKRRNHVRSMSFSEQPMRDGWSCIH